MFIRSTKVIPHWGFRAAPESIEHEVRCPDTVLISLRQIKEQEVQDSCKKDDWIAVVRTEVTVSPEREQQFDGDWNSFDEQEEQRTSSAIRHAGEVLRRFLKIVRWTTGVFGDSSLIRCGKGYEWSRDTVSWNPLRNVPGSAVVSAEVRSAPYSLARMQHNLKFLEVGDDEPVGHELLREAWNLKNNSPRSALVLGLSALEVRTKALIADLVPESEWLCFELQAPPVWKILKDYVPKLPVRQTIEGRAFVPRRALKIIQKSVERRNRVTHRGEYVAYDDELVSTLTTVRSVLYLLDFYSGYDWALSRVPDYEIEQEVSGRWKPSSDNDPA